MSARLSPDQKEALSRVLDAKGGSVHIGGGAGHGKSFLVQEIDRALRGRPGYLKMAPWGLAASNINAVTFYRAFSLHPDMLKSKTPAEIYDKLSRNANVCATYRGLNLMLMDEAHTLDYHTFDKWYEVMKLFRAETDRCRGIRFVFIGCALQLPPVGDDKPYIFKGTTWRLIFDTPVSEGGFGGRHIELYTCHRQSQEQFVYALDCLRLGKSVCLANGIDIGAVEKMFRDGCARYEAKDMSADPARMASLMQSVAELERSNLWTFVAESKLEPLFASQRSRSVDLFCINKNVDAMNLARLRDLPTAEHEFKCIDSGLYLKWPEITKELRAPSVLSLKIGALVCLMVNSFQAEHGLVNGSMGMVVNFESRGTVRWPVVKFFATGKRMLVPHSEFKMERGGVILATRTQIPLQLCWAQTIHKSQGQTYDSVIVHTARAFVPSQIYVAISRVRTLEGFFLDTQGEAVQWESAPEAIDFYKRVGMLNQSLQSLKARSEKQTARAASVRSALSAIGEQWHTCNAHKSTAASASASASASAVESKELCDDCIRTSESALEKLKSKLEKPVYSASASIAAAASAALPEVLVSRLTTAHLQKMQDDAHRFAAVQQEREKARESKEGIPALTEAQRERIEANRRAAVKRRFDAFVEKQRQAKDKAIQPPAKARRLEDPLPPSTPAAGPAAAASASAASAMECDDDFPLAQPNQSGAGTLEGISRALNLRL